MKLEDIKTVEQAKALAFDCIQAIEQQQQNLRAENTDRNLHQIRCRTC
jgi:hypothetical protein